VEDCLCQLILRGITVKIVLWEKYMIGVLAGIYRDDLEHKLNNSLKGI